MELFHTSPEKITTINALGRFGEFLCFASEPYVMTAAATPVVYRLDLDAADVIEADELFYHADSEKLAGLVAKVMDLVDCDEDTAEVLLAGTEALVNVADEFDAELDWDIQAMTAQAAKMLGFKAVKMQDEQGAVWMVAMAGREGELKLVA